MKYANGTEAKVGDRVRLSDGAEGVVVCSIDTDQYTVGYPRTQWEYLKRGVMIDFDKHGLIHYETPDSDLEFVGRTS